MDYKKCWNTLRAESGGRWCQPHPMSNELLTIGELMRNMERRDSEAEELSKQAHNTERDEICPECDSKMLMNPAGNWYCSNWPWCQGKLSPVS